MLPTIRVVSICFMALCWNAGTARPQQSGAAAQEHDFKAITLPSAFPRLAYTPFGYIDNPYHSMVFNRSGVVRSVPPLGFGWWRTNFGGNYDGGDRDHVNYTSFLQMSVTIGGDQFVTPDDFAARNVELSSAYHSKHMVSYDWSHSAVSVSLRFFLPRENTLSCLAEFGNADTVAKEIEVHATNVYGIGDVPWWGSDGLTARGVSTDDVMVSKIWAYGDVFVLGSDLKSIAGHCAESEEDQVNWIRGTDRSQSTALSVRGRGPIRSTKAYHVSLPATSRRSVLFCLSRGKSEAGALQEFKTGVTAAVPELGRQLQDDERFWGACPVLGGDWPETWKRGWVYDFETLRMNVRRPIGIFKHPWDAMQIHSPRAVLGETSLDMMTLGYADPALAREVMEGTFADAQAPNVPCAREDGSVNMISADGSECGTAPMWGFPFHVINALYLASGDTSWIVRLYPHLKDYIEWWLTNRTDAQGWLHCNNSWESGQDGSRRFLVAEKNEGAVADFVRTADVEASMAEAMSLMARFAAAAGRPEEGPYWTLLAEARGKNTRAMFLDGWFRDVDGRTNTPIILEDHLDVMMLSPVTCGVASRDQVEAIKPKFEYFKEHPHPWLDWPPLLFTYTEAAWNAGTRGVAAAAVAEIAERTYRRTDARTPARAIGQLSDRIPGVACEFWPADGVPPGGENYGWGATLPMIIIRTIIGFREKEGTAGGHFFLAPSIPDGLRGQGKTFSIRNLHYRGKDFDVTYVCRDRSRLRVTLSWRSERPAGVTVLGEGGDVIAGGNPGATHGSLSFDGENGSIYVIGIR